MIRTVRAALAVLAIAAIAAACGGGMPGPSGVASLTDPGASPDASATPTASIDPEEAMLAYAECMRENGVDMPDPQISEGGGVAIGINGEVDSETLQAAQEACNDLMSGARGEPREMTPEEKDALLAYSACMREHDVDMPDPVFEGGGAVRIERGQSGEDGEGGKLIDPNSEVFQAADEACRPLLGDFGPDGGPSLQVNPGGPASDGDDEVKP
jgi:hypothetical protein